MNKSEAQKLLHRRRQGEYDYANGNDLPLMVVLPDGCWMWTGPVRGTGYGEHVDVWKVFNGPIPHGLEIDHLCRFRLCMNPAHLEAVTSTENKLRGEGLPARNARKTHCLRGHPLSGDNVFIRTKWNGRQFRRCVTCRRAQQRVNHE